MTATTTTAFAVSDALAAQLGAWRELAEIAITSGPVGDRDPDEWIQIMRPRVTREPRTMTGTRLGGHDEDGTVSIVVMVFRIGQGQDCIDAVRARMGEICAAIEAALASDPTIGGLLSSGGYLSAIGESDQGIEPAPRAGHWMTAELTFSFRTRVYPGAAT